MACLLCLAEAWVCTMGANMKDQLPEPVHILCDFLAFARKVMLAGALFFFVLFLGAIFFGG